MVQIKPQHIKNIVIHITETPVPLSDSEFLNAFLPLLIWKITLAFLILTIRFVIQSFVRCYGIPIQFFKFAEWINKLVLVLIVNKGKSMSVIYKAGSSFPPLKRVVIYFLRGNSPLSNKMEYNCFSFHIFPTGIATPSLVTTTGCFSYKERINDRRQATRAVASATELPDTSASSAR